MKINHNLEIYSGGGGYNIGYNQKNSVWALFDDGSACRINLSGSYQNGDSCIKQDNCSLSPTPGDEDVSQSLKDAVLSAYDILCSLGLKEYVITRANYYFDQSDKENVKNLWGTSSGLAFFIKYLTSIFEIENDVAATGTISNPGTHAEISKVEGISEKLDVAIKKLTNNKNSYLFLPYDNKNEVDDSFYTFENINIYCVKNIKEVLEILNIKPLNIEPFKRQPKNTHKRLKIIIILLSVVLFAIFVQYSNFFNNDDDQKYPISDQTPNPNINTEDDIKPPISVTDQVSIVDIKTPIYLEMAEYAKPPTHLQSFSDEIINELFNITNSKSLKIYNIKINKIDYRNRNDKEIGIFTLFSESLLSCIETSLSKKVNITKKSVEKNNVEFKAYYKKVDSGIIVNAKFVRMKKSYSEDIAVTQKKFNNINNLYLVLDLKSALNSIKYHFIDNNNGNGINIKFSTLTAQNKLKKNNKDIEKIYLYLNTVFNEHPYYTNNDHSIINIKTEYNIDNEKINFILIFTSKINNIKKYQYQFYIERKVLKITNCPTYVLSSPKYRFEWSIDRKDDKTVKDDYLYCLDNNIQKITNNKYITLSNLANGEHTFSIKKKYNSHVTDKCFFTVQKKYKIKMIGYLNWHDAMNRKKYKKEWKGFKFPGIEELKELFKDGYLDSNCYYWSSTEKINKRLALALKNGKEKPFRKNIEYKIILVK